MKLGKDGRMRVYFVKHRGEILKFVVQYHILVGGKWRSVMRFDSCHGYPHKHMYHLRKQEDVIRLEGDLGILLNEARDLIINRGEKIKENFFFNDQI